MIVLVTVLAFKLWFLDWFDLTRWVVF